MKEIRAQNQPKQDVKKTPCGKMVRMKTYIASSVWLNKVEDRFRASNNNAQFTIVVRARSHKRVAELIGGNCSLYNLRSFCGIHEASPMHAEIPKLDDVIYYHVEDTKKGYVGKWLAYLPNIEARH